MLWKTMVIGVERGLEVEKDNPKVLWKLDLHENWATGQYI